MRAKTWPACLTAAIIAMLAVACGGRDDRLESDAIRLTRRGDAGELADARRKLQERWRARRRAVDRGAEARTLEALAEVTDALGDSREALSLFESAVALGDALPPGRTGRLEARMAQVLLASDDTAGAERVIADALRRAASADDVLGRARALYARADLRMRRDLVGRARGDLHEALLLFRAAGDEAWTGLTLQALGVCAGQEGQADESRRLVEESLVLFKRIGDRRGEATALVQLAYLSDQFEHDLERGRRYAADAARIARGTGDLSTLAYSLDSIGVVERMQGHVEAALPWHREALELRRRLHDRRGEAETYFSLGTALRLLGRLDESIEVLRASVATFHELQDDEREGVALWQLARTLQKAGQLDEATPLADRSLALRDAVRRRIAVPTRRALYSDDLSAHYDLAVGVRMQRAAKDGDRRLIEEALLLSERARAKSLLETLALADVRTSDDPRSRRQAVIQHEIEGLEEQLAVAEAAAARSQLEQAIDSRLAEYTELQARLDAEPPASRALGDPDGLELPRLRAALAPGTLVLEYYVGSASSGSLVWAITRDEIVAVPLGTPGELEETARSLYTSLTARAQRSAMVVSPQQVVDADAEVERRASELGRKLLGPVAEQLAGKQRLVVITDGALSYVPFGLLPDERGVPIAVAREVYYVPSLTVLMTLRARGSDGAPPTAALAVYGDPVFSASDARVRSATASLDQASLARASSRAAELPQGGPGQEALTRALDDIGVSELARLPYTQEEASRIASLLPESTSLRLGFAAQKQSIIEGALRGHRWIHLATHGIVDSKHPERSGLVFSRVDETGAPIDGFLRLREIYDLSLSAELVVLSACETAVGREVRHDGLLSVTRGFLHAGARTVLASLWRVDDRATSELMHAFYRALLVERLSPGVALSRAKRFMRESARYHAPYYWAGFELYGDWQPGAAAAQGNADR